jgi:hypothetical protein
MIFKNNQAIAGVHIKEGTVQLSGANSYGVSYGAKYSVYATGLWDVNGVNTDNTVGGADLYGGTMTSTAGGQSSSVSP